MMFPQIFFRNFYWFIWIKFRRNILRSKLFCWNSIIRIFDHFWHFLEIFLGSMFNKLIKNFLALFSWRLTILLILIHFLLFFHLAFSFFWLKFLRLNLSWRVKLIVLIWFKTNKPLLSKQIALFLSFWILNLFKIVIQLQQHLKMFYRGLLIFICIHITSSFNNPLYN